MSGANPYLEHYHALRAGVGRPEQTRQLPPGDQITLQLLDVVVTDTLAGSQCELEGAWGKRRMTRQVGIPEAGEIVVVLFGTTAEGHSVCVRVSGFKPYCWALLPDKFSALHRSKLEGYLKAKGYTYVYEQYYNFYGFQWDPATADRKRNKYVKITAPSLDLYNQLQWLPKRFSDFSLSMVEMERVPTYTKFYDTTQLFPFQWITVTASGATGWNPVSSCDIELKCAMGAWRDEPDMVKPAPYLFASADIECFSASGDFPQACLEDDAVIMVGTVFQRFGQADRTAVSFVLDKAFDARTDPVHRMVQGRDGPIHVLRYPDERRMLEGWRDVVCVFTDADFVLWYNGFRFDLPYVGYRVLKKNPTATSCPESRFFQFSKLLRTCTPLDKRTLTSSAMGDNEMITFKQEYGRITLDLFQIIKTREKLSAYSLDAVCRAFLKATGGTVDWDKGCLEVTGHDTRFSQLKPGDSIQLGEEFYAIGAIASDTRLTLAAVPHDLDNPVCGQRFVGQITKIDMTPAAMFQAYRDGDLTAVIDYCCRDCVAPLELLWKQMYWLNDFEMCKITMTPMQQLYSRGQGIKGLNQVIRFAHARNFLLNRPPPTAEGYKGATVVTPDKGFHTSPVATLDFMSLYPSIIISRWLCWTTLVTDPAQGCHEGVRYIDITNEQGVTFRWAQDVDAVCPMLLKNLLAARKATKKLMGAAEDPHMYDIYNAKQLAQKVSANSIYGLTGGSTTLLSCKAIAECTTAYGRQTLERTKALALEVDPSCQVIYGDSVPGYVPVWVRETVTLPLTMAHALEGTYDNPSLNSRIIQRARVLAIEDLASNFMCTGDKQIAVPDHELEVWTDDGWTAVSMVIRHKTSKALYCITTADGSSVTVTQDHSCLRADGTPVAPANIAVGEELLAWESPPPVDVVVGDNTHEGLYWLLGYWTRWGSWDGQQWTALASDPDTQRSICTIMEDYCDGYTECVLTDAAVTFMGPPGWWHHHHGVPDDYYLWNTLATHAFLAGYGQGCGSGTEARLSMTDQQRLLAMGGHFDYAPATVVAVTRLPAHRGFVYDLQTGSGHFCAGLGRLVVHNTDSIMVKFDLPGTPEGLAEAWRRGQQMADTITDRLGNGIILEMEKTYMPYLLIQKKSYAGIKVEGHPGAKPVRDVKGLDMVKRSTSKFIRRAQARVLDCLLSTADDMAALRLLGTMFMDVALLRVPVDDFVTSSSLKKEYTTVAVQNEVNQLRAARMPGSEYKPGERVPMVAVERRGKDSPLLVPSRYKVAQFMDDPEWVKRQGWRVNRMYYLDCLRTKAATILFSQEGRVNALHDACLGYLHSLTVRSITPYNLAQKIEECVDPNGKKRKADTQGVKALIRNLR